ncbi:hypothetical protein EVAR_65350_1 [Eumeta japonica]|uniref:Uncharacterized protein n=1 Tax=Eumeta variegata TaxID=151549 RepID=A0A4C1Z4Z8_EUMVA|nr:hypothetical protein EVAR_65350_1 [Eumeta japonica]
MTTEHARRIPKLTLTQLPTADLQPYLIGGPPLPVLRHAFKTILLFQRGFNINPPLWLSFGKRLITNIGGVGNAFTAEYPDDVIFTSRASAFDGSRTQIRCLISGGSLKSFTRTLQKSEFRILLWDTNIRFLLPRLFAVSRRWLMCACGGRARPGALLSETI